MKIESRDSTAILESVVFLAALERCEVNFLIENWMLIGLALVSGGMLLWPVLTGGAGAGQVSPTDAVLMMNRDKAVVIDVCDQAEFDAGHVVGARHLPLNRVLEQLPTVAKNKSTPLIMVCASGIRSRGAVAMARKLGYEQVLSLAGGMKAWKAADLPVEKA